MDLAEVVSSRRHELAFRSDKIARSGTWGRDRRLANPDTIDAISRESAVYVSLAILRMSRR